MMASLSMTNMALALGHICINGKELFLRKVTVTPPDTAMPGLGGLNNT